MHRTVCVAADAWIGDMIMKKKTIAVLGTCSLLIVAGVSYTITYRGWEHSPQMVTTLEDQPGQGDPGKDSLRGQTETSRNQPDTVGLSKATDQLSLGQMDLTEIEEQQKEVMGDNFASGSGSDSTEIYVHLCGAVRKPAVYRVEAGARLVDVIGLAGGLTETAAGDYINQAMSVEDGQRIYIPTKAEVEGLTPEEYIVGEGGSPEQESKQRLININQADAGELMELPGIGEAKAESIIAYRNTNGDFTAIEELMMVPGIKEGLYGQIVSYITVN